MFCFEFIDNLILPIHPEAATNDLDGNISDYVSQQLLDYVEIVNKTLEDCQDEYMNIDNPNCNKNAIQLIGVKHTIDVDESEAKRSKYSFEN
jgi:hypothetical protein